jgi:O-antigen/teichoic acid export membrane protein
LQFAKLNAFDTLMGFIHSASHISAALVSPTVWALVFGYLFSSAAATTGSYFLLPGVRQRFYISRRYAWEIAHFGKWIFISSMAFFLATNFDRLYLAKIIPLEIVGVYAIARNISDLASSLFLRLGSTLLFPFISAHTHMPREDFRKQLASIRMKFLMLAAVGFSVVASMADLAIKILYDQRYQAASWMLPVLITGAWFSILANLNESILLGLGKASYSAICNSSKFAILLIGLPLGFKFYGLLGVVIVIASADLGRYAPLLIGQIREGFSFGKQDLLLTAIAFSLIGLWEWLRWTAGFGTSFESLPITG